MKTLPVLSADLLSPLPDKQLRRFMTFFHGAVLCALGMTLYSHWRRAGAVGWAEFALVGLVLIQLLLYGCFMVSPVFPGWPGSRWFRDLLTNVINPEEKSDRPNRLWWWFFYVTSVAVVLAECRIEPAFEWGFFICASQVCMLPIRSAIPASGLVLVAYLLNRFGWSQLARWNFETWVSQLLTVIPFVALFLFFGRMAATSGERGKLILELEAAKRELQLARDREVEVAALRERERLARDLHDTLGHALVTLTVQLEAAQRLQVADPPRVTLMLEGMQKLTRSSMEDLRRSLANLRTCGLAERPLVEALKNMSAEVEKRIGIPIECKLAVGASELPAVVGDVLWRVAQEGFINIEKHARANSATLSLVFSSKEVVMEVSDDGCGLPARAEDKPGHYGLRGLRERVEGLGGRFTTVSAGRGTLIEARIPIIRA